MPSAAVRQILLGGGFQRGAILAVDVLAGRYRNGGGVGYTTRFAGLPGLTVTRATPSVAYAETAAGLLVPFGPNIARITNKGLLPEEARTNLLLRSQEFDNASWIKTSGGVTATADQATAPDGTSTADVVANANTTAGAFYYIRQAPSLTTSTTYTVSAYVKAKTGSGWIWLLGETSVDAFAWFNVSTGVVGAVDAGVTSSITALANGWYRCSATFTKSSASATEEIGVGLTDANSVKNFTPTGVASQEVYVWGAQLEVGAAATSYIPTTTASVARAADVVSIAFSPNGATATVLYGTSSSASPAATSPLNLGASSGGAWVNNYVRSAIVR